MKIDDYLFSDLPPAEERQVVFEDSLTTILCGDVRVLVKDLPHADVCFLDVPWEDTIHGVSWPEFMAPYIQAYLPDQVCGTLLVNTGQHHLVDCWNIAPWKDLVCLHHESKGRWQPYAVYGEARWQNYVSYSDEGGRADFHPAAHPNERADALMSMFPDAKLILEPFMGSGPMIRSARRRGIKGIGIDFNVEYCEKTADLIRGNRAA